METWRDVVGYEGRYEVSSLGNVRALRYRRGGGVRLLKPTLDTHGYPSLTLYGNGPRKSVNVHQIVAAAFHGPKAAGLTVNHIDGNPRNNAAANLEYATLSENHKHAARTGLRRSRAGERNPAAKLTAAAVREARSLRASGALCSEIARRFGVHSSTIARAVSGVRWQMCQEGG